MSRKIQGPRPIPTPIDISGQLNVDNGRLLIEDYVIPGTDILSCNFTLLGLVAEPWHFVRGARTYRSYRDPNTDALIVRDQYSYVFSNLDRDIETIERHINWYDSHGEIGLQKDVSPHPNKKNLKQINRDIRQGRMDFLVATAEELLDMADTIPEPHATMYATLGNSINTVFDFYNELGLEYISRGTIRLEDAIRYEDDPVISQILQIPTVPPSPQFPEGLTVKGSLLYQLTGQPI